MSRGLTGVPTARRSRTIAASAEELWEVIGDPYHLPRWWPRVKRVEDVEGDAFTEVMTTPRANSCARTFTSVAADQHARRLRWEQRIEGTPFARVLKSAETEVRLEPAAATPARRARAVERGAGGEAGEGAGGSAGGRRR